MSGPNTRAGRGVGSILLALPPLAIAAWVYFPITRVYFFADDFLHLAQIQADPIAFLLRPFGGHNYLVRNLVFVASWHAFGLDPEPWYWTVLLTHLLNVWLLFRVIAVLCRSDLLACFGAAVWGVSPFHAGTLAFYSVYGQVIATTVLLVVLARLARLGAGGQAVPARTAALWYALLLAGTVSFGTGMGVALAFPAVLFLLHPGAWRQPYLRLASLALPAVALAGFVGLKRVYALLRPVPPDEAVQLRLALAGLPRAPALLAHLLGFGVVGTMLGVFLQPEGAGLLDKAVGVMTLPPDYPDARAWACMVGFAAGLGLISWRGDAQARRTALAMLALAASVYATIAVGRAGLYQGAWPSAQSAAFLRYHYLGTVPLTVLLCQILYQLGRLPLLAAVPRRLALAGALGALVAVNVRHRVTFDEHPKAREYVALTARVVADAAAAAPPGATVYVDNAGPGRVLGNWLFPLEFPGRAGVFLLLGRSDDRVDGRRIRFVESDPEVLRYWRMRPAEPLARLLADPGEGGQ